MSKKTGVRLSRPVAFILLFTLCGWFVTLGFIIRFQSQRIHEQQRELTELLQWKQQTSAEIQSLRERIRPMEQLGLLKESGGTRGNE
jgi:sensor domain CHASE-containing protein